MIVLSETSQESWNCHKTNYHKTLSKEITALETHDVQIVRQILGVMAPPWEPLHWGGSNLIFDKFMETKSLVHFSSPQAPADWKKNGCVVQEWPLELLQMIEM